MKTKPGMIEEILASLNITKGEYKNDLILSCIGLFWKQQVDRVTVIRSYLLFLADLDIFSRICRN